MSDLILDQFSRLLTGLPAGDPWPALNESGFLDLLRSEDDGGAGLSLEDLFPLALDAGRREVALPVIETMVARLVSPEASNVTDLEAALTAAQVPAAAARALAAGVTAALMAGALEAVQALSLEYASTRKQFGREISKFQAIQHHLAVVAEETMAARMAAQAAFQGAPLEIDARRAGAAKLRAGQAAVQVASIAHAVHGAIGVSQEYPLHRFTGRLHKQRLAHGGEAYWARKLGEWALSERDDVVTLARSF